MTSLFYADKRKKDLPGKEGPFVFGTKGFRASESSALFCPVVGIASGIGKDASMFGEGVAGYLGDGGRNADLFQIAAVGKGALLDPDKGIGQRNIRQPAAVHESFAADDFVAGFNDQRLDGRTFGIAGADLRLGVKEDGDLAGETFNVPGNPAVMEPPVTDIVSL